MILSECESKEYKDNAENNEYCEFLGKMDWDKLFAVIGGLVLLVAVLKLF